MAIQRSKTGRNGSLHHLAILVVINMVAALIHGYLPNTSSLAPLLKPGAKRLTSADSVKRRFTALAVKMRTDNCGVANEASNDLSDISSELDLPQSKRRALLNSFVYLSTISFSFAGRPLLSNANDDTDNYQHAPPAVITHKIFFDLKGIPDHDEGSTNTTDTIVIGLYGQVSPQPVSIILQLISPSGLQNSKCKPRQLRSYQREQLEANKVYNSCVRQQELQLGVTYDYSTVWRIEQDVRIDVGAVSGKFLAREFPTFEGNNDLKHDDFGVVSVRRGNESGFGFTIYSGNTSNDSSKKKAEVMELDSEYIVIGKVLEGMSAIQRLNDTPVVRSASVVNYKAFTTNSNKKKNAPSRTCRYGASELYCSEKKPLVKILVVRTGIL